MPTLCHPHPEILCFGCCPPIRPPNYDPLDHITSLRREFADNRRRFLLLGPNQGAIVGFSCWALGFLDTTGRHIGCLLHPAQHRGHDLRSVTGYGDKCRRELCLPARAFEVLSPEVQSFCLELGAGLPSFYYSSPRANPLFHILLWGMPVLEHLCRNALLLGLTATELLWWQPFLIDRQWSPRAYRYPLRLILESDLRPGLEAGSSLAESCRHLWQRIHALPEAHSDEKEVHQRHHVHQLPLNEDYLDFLRVALRWQRTSWERAVALQREIESLVAQGQP